MNVSLSTYDGNENDWQCSRNCFWWEDCLQNYENFQGDCRDCGSPLEWSLNHHDNTREQSRGWIRNSIRYQAFDAKNCKELGISKFNVNKIFKQTLELQVQVRVGPLSQRYGEGETPRKMSSNASAAPGRTKCPSTTRRSLPSSRSTFVKIVGSYSRKANRRPLLRKTIDHDHFPASVIVWAGTQLPVSNESFKTEASG